MFEIVWFLCILLKIEKKMFPKLEIVKPYTVDVVPNELLLLPVFG